MPDYGVDTPDWPERRRLALARPPGLLQQALQLGDPGVPYGQRLGQPPSSRVRIELLFDYGTGIRLTEATCKTSATRCR
jgi:hypothetical protein